MSTVLNIERFIIPSDVIVSLTNIYRWIGKNSFFTDAVKGDLERIIEATVERDAFFLSQIIKLNLTDSRSRLIITKNSTPRSKDEATLYQIKDMIRKFQLNYRSYRHQSNDLLDVANFLFSHYHEIRFSYEESDKKSVLKSQARTSKRVILNDVNDRTQEIIQKKSFEKITLYLNYYIDFYNIAPFTERNEETALFLLYLFVLKSDLEAFRYISFFELLYKNYSEFQTEVKKASFNWKEGFAQPMGFIRFMLSLFLKGYQKAYELIKDYQFDTNLNKGYNIENTITKFPEIFTKDEIRIQHPFVSDSTINRTLIKMRDRGLIKPLGKGRSAKWIRIAREQNYDEN
ncbi:MAG: hypothetical protein PHX62_02200 [Bacilli bacterium]|nr:hypothetical protein [Bacilli bacterium]